MRFFGRFAGLDGYSVEVMVWFFCGYKIPKVIDLIDFWKIEWGGIRGALGEVYSVYEV